MWEWPFVFIDEKDKLPPTPGVYLAVCNGKVLYVGQTRNLRRRWQSHEKLGELSTYSYVRIGWAEINAADERNAIELLLCERFDPPLNRIRPQPSHEIQLSGIRYRLGAILREKGKTPYWLAKTSGVSPQTVYALVKGTPLRRLDMAVLEKLARALGCEPGELLEMREG